MLALVRIRGSMNVIGRVDDTMKMLGLKEVNNCVIIPEEPTYMGMVEKCRDYIAYGKIDHATFMEMFKKRARLSGERKLDEKNVKEIGFHSIDQLAKEIFEGKLKMNKIEGLHKTFRLTPPHKGYASTKEHYPQGSLGDWGDKITELLKKMI